MKDDFSSRGSVMSSIGPLAPVQKGEGRFKADVFFLLPTFLEK
jgi:hypothetical protein